MANKQRLIDANALVDKFWQEECRTQTRRDFVAMVNYAPTVDAVEVVRCKDCKHYYHSVYAMCCVCDFDSKEWDKDDFCSYGERRTND